MDPGTGYDEGVSYSGALEALRCANEVEKVRDTEDLRDEGHFGRSRRQEGGAALSHPIQ
jgi:hypothetical protein